jgi:hypothetical protein
MAKARVLLLGNSPQINEIQFDRIADDVITLGLNRIWLKYIPKYFFFHDLIISNELSRHPETLAKLIQNSTIFSSQWIRKNKNNLIPNWTQVYPMPPARQFPDSASLSIQILSKNILKSKNITFYTAGIPLLWQEPSHFWKEINYSASAAGDKQWYDTRFPRMVQNFRVLKNLGYDIVSVTPNSALNKIFRYESIDNLYKRKL